VDSDFAVTISVGSVFQMCGAADAKAQLPTVDVNCQCQQNCKNISNTYIHTIQIYIAPKNCENESQALARDD